MAPAQSAEEIAPLRDTGAENARSRPPNFVIIFADDLGYGDLGCYGAEDAKTPHIDRLAFEGVRCTEFYVPSPLCSPSRASLLTGRYPRRHKLQRVLSGKEAHLDGLRPKEVLISEMLHDAGYESAMVGKWHLGVNPVYRPLRRGFDEFFGMLYGASGYFTHSYKGTPDLWKNEESIVREGYSTELFTDAAVDFIRRHRNAPFLLYLAYNAPHIADDLKSLPAPDQYKALYEKTDIPERRREYLSVVSALDAGVGEIVNCIDELGLEKDTVVVFLSDNGAGWKFGGSNLWLRGGKNSLDEGGIRVPCVFRWTDKLPPGTVCREPMIAMDITRTMIDLAGAQRDKPVLDGRNILPTLQGRSPTPHKYLFWDYHDARALRVGSDRWTRHPNLLIELNDLSKDPEQSQNLAGKQPEKCDRMSQSWDHIARLIDAGTPLPDDLP